MEVRHTQVRIKRIDEDRQIVFAEVYAPFKTDTYGDFMLPEDIEIMAHRALKLDLSSLIDINHDEKPISAHPVESFIARAGDPDYTEGAWVLGVKIEDAEAWAAVKRGDLNGFSFQAMVREVEYEIDLVVFRDEVGETEAADGHTHFYFLQYGEDGKLIGGITSEEDGHSHVIRHGTATEDANGHSHRFFVGG